MKSVKLHQFTPVEDLALMLALGMFSPHHPGMFIPGLFSTFQSVFCFLTAVFTNFDNFRVSSLTLQR